MRNNPIVEKSEAFAIEVIKLGKELTRKKHFELASQITRSGTSIGANVAEAQFAQSKKDFISKVSIALKEARETQYWLRSLYGGELISKEQYDVYYPKCEELVRILVAITKSAKQCAVGTNEE